MKSLPVHGRGASYDPPNRFLDLHVEREGWTDPDDPAPRTRLYRDASRSIITYNDSPDVGFDSSVNPYRGCEHGCVYCLDGRTPILMGDGSARPIARLKPGDEIYGTVRRGFYRRYVRTHVSDHWSTEKPAYRITLADGTGVVASGDHRFLTYRGWKHVTGTDQGAGRRPHLTLNDRLLGFGGTDAIRRKRNIEGAALKTGADLRVVSIEPVGRRTLFDISTATGDFIANGVVSHNCYARPNHEYLGLSAGLDFETKIFVKEDAPELLRRELASPKWRPQVLLMSGVTDPYQPAEKRLCLTRGALQLLAECRHPCTLVTKNALVERDLDLLAQMAQQRLVQVFVSINSLDNRLAAKLEPRASAPHRRLRCIEKLASAGVPVGVLVAPIIPALNDRDMESVLERAARAGARCAGYTTLRLPWELKSLFREWLQLHAPQRADHVMSLVSQLHGGRDYDADFRTRMRGQGVFADLLRRRFEVACRRFGYGRARDLTLDTTRFRPPRPDTPQGELF